MGVPYIEEFKVNDRQFAIEDYEDGKPMKDHFFGSDYPKDSSGNPMKRYRLWTGGCGFGQADTLTEARRKVHAYAVTHEQERRTKAKAQLDAATDALARLGDDVFHLGRFRVDSDE